MKVEGVFAVPAEGTIDKFKVKIIGGDHGTIIDDLRIFPVAAGMETYVYDKQNHRLMCVLDNNNYGTFYQYDDDGSLKKVERETLSGRVTIQEGERWIGIQTP